jgi:hypothetical protein
VAVDDKTSEKTLWWPVKRERPQEHWKVNFSILASNCGLDPFFKLHSFASSLESSYRMNP